MSLNEKTLLSVEKPARYVGNEINVVNKEITDKIKTRFCISYPDIYEIGMSNLGMQIIYYMLNEVDDVYCERVFSPSVDLENVLIENSEFLFSLETGTSLCEFDFLGISLPYELCYTNVLNMLKLGGIELLAKDRKDGDTIVIAGGTGCYNPAPMHKFIDIFYIGEGEATLKEVVELHKECKESGLSRDEFLKKACKIDGIYVPKFYEEVYDDNGYIVEHKPLFDDVPKSVKKVLVKDLDNMFTPKEQLLPLIETVHDRASVEIFRGCIRGCRFCQAGYVMRPTREKSSDNIINNCNELINTSGYEEVSLVSLSTADFRDFNNLSTNLLQSFDDKKVNVSIPSLRVDAVNLDLLAKIQDIKKSSLTFAPEAGSQRMRDVINKNITEEEIINGVDTAFKSGWNKVKLYFMIGLPTEQTEDLYGIVNLSEKIVAQYFTLPKEERKTSVKVIASSSCFIPKPFTAFQWEKQDSFDEFTEKQKLIRNSFKSRNIRYNYHDASQSIIEGILSRGDRRVADVIELAFSRGAKFDSWSDKFDYELWIKCIEDSGIDLSFYTTRKREYDEVLPWDFIDIGVTKQFLMEESKKAKGETVTPNCREKCVGCGARVYDGGVCFEK